MDAIPRITRAQPMDALSSQATVAGYKAVLIAAGRSRKFFPMLMTAAGTIAPAKVLVLGAGRRGAPGDRDRPPARRGRLGYDVRPAVKEQVESLGAKFLELDVEGAEGAGGYASALVRGRSSAPAGAARAHAADADAVISTALIPGARAAAHHRGGGRERCSPGSVIVDLAAETGGNCAGTEAGRRSSSTASRSSARRTSRPRCRSTRARCTRAT